MLWALGFTPSDQGIQIYVDDRTGHGLVFINTACEVRFFFLWQRLVISKRVDC
jgi:hypothetical protein